MTTHVFFHSADLDGMCSGAICKYFMPEAVLHGINYGEAFPWSSIQPDDKVYMADFSLQPFDDMVLLNQVCNLYWIDHHLSAIEDYWGLGGKTVIQGVRNMKYAACELCWHYFAHNKEGEYKVENLPLAVYWLGRYDIWKHEEVPGSLEFQYGMRLYDTRPENQEFWRELFNPPTQQAVNKIRDEGAMLLRYERMQNERFARSFAFETELDGLRCIALNKGFSNSLVFESVYDPQKHDAMLSFVCRGGKWHISLYATKPEIDVSVICKARGGGGHKGASGFQCETLPFLEK